MKIPKKTNIINLNSIVYISVDFHKDNLCFWSGEFCLLDDRKLLVIL